MNIPFSRQSMSFSGRLAQVQHEPALPANRLSVVDEEREFVGDSSTTHWWIIAPCCDADKV
jgi:hypothetical protein